MHRKNKLVKYVATGALQNTGVRVGATNANSVSHKYLSILPKRHCAFCRILGHRTSCRSEKIESAKKHCVNIIGEN